MWRRRRTPPNLLSLHEALAWVFSPPVGIDLLEPALVSLAAHASHIVSQASNHDLYYILLDNDADARIAATAALELLNRQLPRNIRSGVLQRAKHLTPNATSHPIYRELKRQIREVTM